MIAYFYLFSIRLIFIIDSLFYSFIIRTDITIWTIYVFQYAIGYVSYHLIIHVDYYSRALCQLLNKLFYSILIINHKLHALIFYSFRDGGVKRYPIRINNLFVILLLSIRQ